MKKLYLIIVFTLCLTAVFGQRNRRDVIEAEKAAFFTRTLKISQEEAEKFWPVYYEFSEKRDELVKERNELTRNVGQNFNEIPDDELIKAGDELIALDLKEAQLKAEYHEKFKDVLSPVKVVRLYYAETRFKTYLLNQLRSRRDGEPGNLKRERF